MAQTVKRNYSKFSRWRIRQLSNVRALLHERRKVIFIHVPKTAGSAVRAHLRVCLGSNASGRSIGLNDVPFEDRPIETRLAAAQKAQFVHGHLDWRSVEHLGRSEAFTFTFLRAPRARLFSLYGFMTSLPDWIDERMERHRRLIVLCRGKTPQQLAASRDPTILAHVDNYMVRQLAGSVQDYPVAPDAWPQLLERAKRNLISLDFVGLQESFDRDFAHILKELNLPGGGSFKTINGTLRRAKADLEIDPALYEWDQKLFDWASAHVRSREASRASSVDEGASVVRRFATRILSL